jgi:hypothetical protein
MSQLAFDEDEARQIEALYRIEDAARRRVLCARRWARCAAPFTLEAPTDGLRAVR